MSERQDEIPPGLTKLDVEVAAANRLVDELSAVIEKWKNHPNVSAFTVLAALEAVKLAHWGDTIGNVATREPA